MRRAVLALALVVVGCSGRALAHGGEGASLHAVLGPVAFLVGAALVAVAVTLDARDAVAPGRADLGVLVGGALALVGVATSVAL